MGTINPEHIPQRPNGACFPLSSAQQGFWLADQLEPGNVFSNIALEANLDGALDTSLLERCLNEIVDRHDALRITFTQHGEDVAQTIAPSLTLALPLIDLSGFPAASREQELRQRIAAEANASFDLQRGPLLSTTLFKLAEQKHVFLLVVHHIVFDGRSMGVFNRELEVLYAAYGKGQPSPLAATTIRYVDYAVRQRQSLHGADLEKLLGYWREKLAAAPRLILPSDRPGPARPDFRINLQELQLAPDLSAALKQLAAREHCTLFMLLLAAFKVLLHRHSGQEDIVVGAPVAGRRNHDEFKGSIGAFINTIVLRTDLSGDPGFCELLKREREVALGAYRHASLPFEKLVEELRPDRNAGVNPFVDALVNFCDESWFTLKLDGITSGKVRRMETYSDFALSLKATDCADGLELELRHQSSRVSPELGRNLLNRYRLLLEGIVASPQARLSALPLLTAAERRQLLVEWNDTARGYPQDRCVHQLFEAQVARTPNAVAAVFEDRQLSYAELNTQANRLAHHLIRLGVGPGVLVGLCMARSPELIAGLLGILKAGGAYVPIDPAWPVERTRLVIEDAALAALVTRQIHVQRLPAESVPVVCIDCLPSLDHAAGVTDPEGAVSPAGPAYVLYTSGTTGRPKGVLIEHRNLLHYVLAITDRIDLRSDGHYAMLQPLSVDSCLTMIFPALCRGGTLHLISEERALDAHALAEYFRRHRIDYLKIAPSHLAALLDQLPSVALLPERALIIGGEASHWDFIDRLRSLAPRCVLWNHYGPTETTVGVSVFRIERGDVRNSNTVPIGRPLANVRYYLLDRRLQPVPVGVSGELYIGGDQVGRGYLNRPELDAERFVPEIYGAAHGARMYRSGDHARYLPDGNVEFLGRSDGQVKIRGFRIELGEIEAALREAGTVSEVCVTALDTGAQGQRLLACIVTRGGLPLNEPELKAALRSRLPDYMIPSQFVQLAAMPLTPHGKVDRNALPAPRFDRGVSDDPYAAPLDPFGERIARVWAELMQLNRVGAHEDFFELGGHSLLGMQLVTRLNSEFSIHMPLRSLFDNPTVVALGREVERLQLEAMRDEMHVENLLLEVELLAEDDRT